MASSLGVRIGNSLLKDAQEAIRELFGKITQTDMTAVIFFCSAAYDLDLLGKALKESFPCPVIGCTSAGEISPAGYQDGGIVAASIASPRLRLHPRLIFPLSGFGSLEMRSLADSLREQLVFSGNFNKEKMFGLILIDGMSVLEEHIIALFAHQLDGTFITGGSAGDDLRFKETRVYWDGAFLPDAALFTLFETTLPFHVFQTQHFRPTDQKLVITEADPGRRIVTEINAEPAAQAYAGLLGLPVSELTPRIFSRHPLMLKIGDSWYVRSIQKANADGNLSFYCAIDRGLVLTLAEGHDMVEGLAEALLEISGKISPPGLIIGCDCIHRKLEAMDKGLIPAMERRLKDTPFLGFNTYGEQIGAIHVNQTLTGVAIGTG